MRALRTRLMVFAPLAAIIVAGTSGHVAHAQVMESPVTEATTTLDQALSELTPSEIDGQDRRSKLADFLYSNPEFADRGFLVAV